jgi:hypothetical protein
MNPLINLQSYLRYILILSLTSTPSSSQRVFFLSRVSPTETCVHLSELLGPSLPESTESVNMSATLLQIRHGQKSLENGSSMKARVGE